MSFLSMREVHKSFAGNEVLKGVSLEMERGQVVCVIGPSGSGKSTFLRCINRLETIDAGLIAIEGDPIGAEVRGGRLHAAPDKKIRAQREQIGMVFQSFNLFPHMTVLENIIEAPVGVRGEKKADAVAHALQLLARVGLAEKRDAYPKQLSVYPPLRLVDFGLFRHIFRSLRHTFLVNPNSISFAKFHKRYHLLNFPLL